MPENESALLNANIRGVACTEPPIYPQMTIAELQQKLQKIEEALLQIERFRALWRKDKAKRNELELLSLHFSGEKRKVVEMIHTETFLAPICWN